VYQKKVSKLFVKKLIKIGNKNPTFKYALDRKVEQIMHNPSRFKPLRGTMQGIRRVHIQSSFVVLFEIHKNSIYFLDIDHHDTIY
jgi:YafQ family addiction module toxin component